MPLTKTDQKVLDRFKDEYGAKEGERRFYASINSGAVKGIPEAKRIAVNRGKGK